MTLVVLDASAAVRMVVGPAPAAIAQELRTAQRVIAPALIQEEVANALWKYVRADVLTPDQAGERLTAALNLCDELLADTTVAPNSVITEAFHEACRQRHPVYDMVYLVTARRYSATLATCDQELARLASACGVAFTTSS